MSIYHLVLGCVCLFYVLLCVADDPHPYNVRLSMSQRSWNAIYNPRLERNFCCCYCTGNSVPVDSISGSIPEADDDGSMIGGVSESIAPSRSFSIVNGGYKYGNWLMREDLESHCGFEYCRVMFPYNCLNHRTTIYSGATGLHDPYRKLELWKQRQQQQQAATRRAALEARLHERMDDPHANPADSNPEQPPNDPSMPPLPADHPLSLRLSEIVGRCEAVRAEGGAWWNTFQDLGPS